jgi:MerR family transcriptional regulator, thiopeptide resistance regulator
MTDFASHIKVVGLVYDCLRWSATIFDLTLTLRHSLGYDNVGSTHMSYTVQQLAKLSGISVRTLHYYDQMGLLKPLRVKKNGYRHYEENELLKLQQILFFRELEFPLEDIKRIMKSPTFDMKEALRDQKALIELKKKRLDGLMKTIDKTIKKINNNTPMDDKDLYDNLNKKEMQEYAAEAKERWGNTEAYKQSQERVKKMTKEDWARVKKAGDELMREIAASYESGEDAKSSAAQALIARHYDGLRTFYEPNLQMYRGLAEMYVADPRFAAFYEKYAKGLAVFMHDAMIHYADTHK